MKPARLIVLGVALAAGGVAAYLASGGRQAEAPKAPPPPPLATVDVLIAKSDLDTGQVVSDKDIAWQTWPAASTGSNFIKKPDRPDAIKDFVGAIVRSPVMAGEPIRDSKVVNGKGGGFMAAILPHGMRAISLDIAPDTSAGGFILPNDHVDVLLTRHDKAAEKISGLEKLISETVLRNVRVLAVDQTVGEKDGQKVVIGKTATIELDPHQAETLALSRQLGTLSLTLRSLLDSQSPTPEGGDNQEEKAGAGINTVRYGVSTQSTTR
ncbi:MAG: Flp pilus assembly protein CpaB [Xanthobacteraceae bacterium]|nr:Flp pilus assembly protein CpaB [Xanthobacteraceae bacterium]